MKFRDYYLLEDEEIKLTSEGYYTQAGTIDAAKSKSSPKNYGITNYFILSNGSLDVDGDVILKNMGLKKLPYSFHNVTGNFVCTNNELETLIGSPEYVGGNFYCSANKLMNLNGIPREVRGNFDCSDQDTPHKPFTEQEVLAECEVGGEIRV